jgi:tetratricopeptide (TPR) repeat protein
MRWWNSESVTADFNSKCGWCLKSFTHQSSSDLEMGLHVAEALVGKGNLLVDLGRYDEALRCYDRVVAQFGEADVSDLARQVRVALFKKGAVFVILDRLGEVDGAFDALRRRASQLPDAEAQARVEDAIARVLYKRACVLFNAGEYGQATRAADAVLLRFNNDGPRRLRLDIVVNALRLKAYADSVNDHQNSPVAITVFPQAG